MNELLTKEEFDKLPPMFIPNQSESIAKLGAALSKAQGEIKGVKKENEQPHFNSKYADLESCWEACRKPLSDNGLAVIQTNGGSLENQSIITTLVHSSGEWMRGELYMLPDRKGPQAIGAIITYARRYALCAIVGLSPTDDDGYGRLGSGKGGKVTSNDVLVNEIQIEYAEKHCELNDGEIIEKLMWLYSKSEIKDLTVSELKAWAEEDGWGKKNKEEE